MYNRSLITTHIEDSGKRTHAHGHVTVSTRTPTSAALNINVPSEKPSTKPWVSCTNLNGTAFYHCLLNAQPIVVFVFPAGVRPLLRIYTITCPIYITRLTFTKFSRHISLSWHIELCILPAVDNPYKHLIHTYISLTQLIHADHMIGHVFIWETCSCRATSLVQYWLMPPLAADAAFTLHPCRTTSLVQSCFTFFLSSNCVYTKFMSRNQPSAILLYIFVIFELFLFQVYVALPA